MELRRRARKERANPGDDNRMVFAPGARVPLHALHAGASAASPFDSPKAGHRCMGICLANDMTEDHVASLIFAASGRPCNRARRGHHHRMATNPPTGDGHRNGAIRDRSQVWSPNGHRTERRPFKGVRKDGKK